MGGAYTGRCGGLELCKVLYYYGILFEVETQKTKIMCPFHADKNPSMVLDFEKGSFFCFGCGAKGDAFEFVRMCNPNANDLGVMREYVRALRGGEGKNIVFHPAKKKK